MISLLVGLIVFLVIVYIASLVVDAMALPHPAKTIVMLVLGLVFLVWLVRALGVWV